MAFLDRVPCLLLLIWLPQGLWGRVVIHPDDPYSHEMSQPDFTPESEPETNQTIDEIFRQQFGDDEDYMQHNFMSPGGTLKAELDMQLTLEQYQDLYGDYYSRQKRKAVRNLKYRWTNGVIPYEFVKSHFTVKQVYTIKQAMQEWQDATCLTFRPATYRDRNRIRFQNGKGCNIYIIPIMSLMTCHGLHEDRFGIGLHYEIRLSQKSIYLHEIGHAIGLVHEHQLPDRDKYISINYTNVKPSWKIWFNKYTTRTVNQYGVPFDYYSIMHYGPSAFSKDGRSITIQTKDPKMMAVIGSVYHKSLAFSDIKVVNLMYGCNRRCKADPSCKAPGYLDKDCDCVPCPSHIMNCTTGEGIIDTITNEGKSECKNDWADNKCDFWAGIGECHKNPRFMKVRCKKSCHACPKKAATTRPPTITNQAKSSAPPKTTGVPSTQPPVTSSATFTTSAAPSTKPPKTSTAAPSTKLPQTSTSAPSTKLPKMSTTKTPATTSRKPSTTPEPATTPKTDCKNDWPNNQCDGWAQKGECDKNPRFMKVHCKKSCNTCTKDDCENHNTHCLYWRRYGYCNTSPYMTRYCRKACNLC